MMIYIQSNHKFSKVNKIINALSQYQDSILQDSVSGEDIVVLSDSNTYYSYTG